MNRADQAEVRLSRSAIFEPFSDEGRAEEIVDRISAALRLGLLVDGEQLPTEAELSAQLGVSTVTLREALVKLRVNGLIETRRGRNGGSFVRRREPTREGLQHRLLSKTTTQWRDLADEHAAISGMSAMLAARRATNEDIRRLRTLAAIALTPEKPEERSRAESRFHIRIAVSSQSERLTKAEVRMQTESAGLLDTHGTGEGLGAVRLDDGHTEIIDAIEAEDGPLARDLAEAHVREMFNNVIRLRFATIAAQTAKAGTAG